MLRLTSIMAMLALGLIAMPFICGCDGDDSDPNRLAAGDISGRWSGTAGDALDTGTGTAIEFLFFQSGNHLTGTASFLGPINGTISGRTVRIEGSDLKGILSEDGRTISGSFTDTGGAQKLFAVVKEDD